MLREEITYENPSETSEGMDTESHETDTEGTQNEDNTSTESNNTVNIEPTPYPTSCTVVYTADYQQVCAEDIAQDQGTQENPYYVLTLDDRAVELANQANIIRLLNDVKNNQETIIQGQDATELMAIYEEINTTLSNVYDFVGVALGLYFVGWIISVFNSWRRNNS